MSLSTIERDPDYDLIDAARYGHTEKLQNCLKRGANINFKNRFGNTALHIAVDQRYTEIVKLLIDGGIDLNIQDTDGKTALHNAAGQRKPENTMLLIDAGIDLNTRDKNDNTALHIAVDHGFTEIVRLLIDGGIDFNLKTKDHSCVLCSIIGWNAVVGSWTRVEGTPNDPNPNKPFAKIEVTSTFTNDGKLNPSITVIGSIVQIPSEEVILNSIVLPDKSFSGSYKNQIIL